MIKNAFTILFIIISFIVTAQKKDLRPQLYKLEERIINGDSKALKEIAMFLDDTSFVQEFLGYHNWPNTARRITMRVIEENCLFNADEFKLDSSASTDKFLKVVNNTNTVFDELTGSFLITPLTKRNTEYELKELSKYDMERIDTSVIKNSFPDWYYEEQVDWLLARKNPDALMWIAAAWYKKRTRFNRYYFNDNEFLDLIKKLTHTDLGVPDEKGKISFLYKDDFYSKARLNYLIYWANHAKDYKWSDEKGYFENVADKATGKSREEILFSLLDSQDDSIAIDAFSQLAELDTGKVSNLADQYESNDIDNNFSLPTFPYRFLKQMVLLTQYCRANEIKYKAGGWLLDSLNKLKLELSYKERYGLENNIIEKLSPKDITMVEFFGLINEEGPTHSIGRILDKFYSKNWMKIVADPENLRLYLKKSAWFDRLGIIGICNKFLRKFENASVAELDAVRSMLKVNDPDIREQTSKVITTYNVPAAKKIIDKKRWAGSNDIYGVKDLKNKFYSIEKSKQDKEKKEHRLEQLFGSISYQQIGQSIYLLQKDTVLKDYNRVDFLESDFGLPVTDSVALETFVSLYKQRSEYQLYEYYLKQTGMNCFDKAGELYFPGIYETLKYDVVDAFVGGGGGRRDDGVYLVIKLLELKFQTTLGFPKKLCSSQGSNYCDCTERAKAWMGFLIEKKMVTAYGKEPVSISSND